MDKDSLAFFLVMSVSDNLKSFITLTADRIGGPIAKARDGPEPRQGRRPGSDIKSQSKRPRDQSNKTFLSNN